MKKTLTLILFTFLSFYCRAGLPFSEVNNAWNLSFIGSYVGYNDPISYGAVGGSLTIKGFYIDIMGFSPIHNNDVRVDKWNDKSSFLCHFGYQIPIIKQLRLIPVVGYAHISQGITDGSNWTVGNNGISNKYHSLRSVSRFDYGGIIVLNYKRAIFNIGITRTCITGGIGLEL